MAEVRGEIAATTGMSQSLMRLGTALTLGLTVPIAALGVISVKAFADFDEGMRNINSIMQLGEDQFQSLSNSVLHFGEDTRKGATDAAQALYSIVSAGFGVNDTAEAMKLLEVSVKGAEAGLADTSKVAELLAQSLLAFGENASSAQHYMDVLTQTVNLGVGSMDDVASSIGQVINIAALAGVKWDELGGSMAFLTQRGMSFANASVSINQIISQLIKPTEGLTAAFAQLGVANGTELIAKFGGLGGALEALGSVAGTSADDLGKLFTNVRSLRGAASILGNFGDYTKLMESFGESINGVTDRAHIQQAKSLASQLDHVWSGFKGLLTTIGKALEPKVGVLTDIFAGLFKDLSNLNPEVIQTAVNIGLVVAAIGPLLLILGAITSPIGLIVTGLVILAKAFSDNFLGIKDAIDAALPNIKKAWYDFQFALLDVYVFVGETMWSITETFNKYLSGDIATLIHDVFVGDWVKAKADLSKVFDDIIIMIGDKVGDKNLRMILANTTDLIKNVFVGDWKKAKDDLDRIWVGISGAFYDHLAKPIGDALVSLGEKDFGTIVLGITAIGAAIAIAGGIMLIVNIPALLTAIGVAALGLITALGPLGLAIILASTLVIAYQNNWLGFKDTIDNVIAPSIIVFTALIEKQISRLQVIAALFAGILHLPQPDWVDDTTQPTGMGNRNGNAGINPKFGMGSPKQNFDDFNKLAGYNTSQALMPVTQPLNSLGSWNGPTPRRMSTSTGNGGSGGTATYNQISIQSNDPDYIMRELRRKGVDLDAQRRG